MSVLDHLFDEPFKDYVGLLRRHHQLWVEKKEETPEADALCDAMDGPWERLSSEQTDIIGGLSSDLMWIVDGPAPSNVPREEAFRENLPGLNQALESGNWLDVLKHLRPLAPFLPAAEVAFLRGRAWTHLGDDETALLFFEHAHKLDPQDKAFAWVARDCSAGNGTTAAAAQAEEVCP